MENITCDKLDIFGDGGLLKELIQAGEGDDTPTNGCRVSIHFTGKLTNGTVFDSSLNSGEPIEFTLGKSEVIRAFDLGVPTMKLHEKCVFTCAPEYAYGADGIPPTIPPNATLIMECELLGWKGQDISPGMDGSIERFIIKSSEKRRNPDNDSIVKVHLIGRYDKKVFDEREVKFTLGEGSEIGIVEGVEIAIERMSIGEVSKIIIKPAYAFGAEGFPMHNIPPNADIEYVITLLEFETTDDWKLGKEERVQKAETLKKKGTDYFLKGNYKLAIKMYTKCLDILNDIEDDQKSIDLLIAAHNNTALCHQKTNNQYEAKQSCNHVLGLDPNNIKALYRRGLCNLVVGDYQEALQDFQTVIKLDPLNKAAKNQILICSQKTKEASDKERKIYANMFTKLAACNKEEEPVLNTDILAKCGEWTDEDTRREVDRALECDNIVMI